MSRKSPSNVAASVQQRLLNKSRKEGEDYQHLLTRFALERYLYRLGLSRYKEKFILKGAMLFPLWGGEIHRPTRDLDLESIRASWWSRKNTMRLSCWGSPTAG